MYLASCPLVRYKGGGSVLYSRPSCGLRYLAHKLLLLIHQAHALDNPTLRYCIIAYTCCTYTVTIVSAHRRILGMVSVVCVLVKICVSSISLYKLDTDKLTTPFESAHQFTLVCTVSDSKTVPGCHYDLCSNHSFVLTD